MIDVEAIFIVALVSALVGAVIETIIGFDLLGLITTVIFMFAVLAFMYSSPTPIEIANFLVWGVMTIFAAGIEMAFSETIKAIFGKRSEPSY
jgi:hypothetical protein